MNVESEEPSVKVTTVVYCRRRGRYIFILSCLRVLCLFVVGAVDMCMYCQVLCLCVIKVMCLVDRAAALLTHEGVSLSCVCVC